MAKELRLNDKIWFGQYKGYTVRKIYQIDRSFIERMVSTGRFVLSHNVTEFFKKEKEHIYKSSGISHFENDISFSFPRVNRI